MVRFKAKVFGQVRKCLDSSDKVWLRGFGKTIERTKIESGQLIKLLDPPESCDYILVL